MPYSVLLQAEDALMLCALCALWVPGCLLEENVVHKSCRAHGRRRADDVHGLIFQGPGAG